MKLNFSSILSIAVLIAGAQAKLSKNDQNNLLALHRSARHHVGSPEMKEIHWNDRLAADAEVSI